MRYAPGMSSATDQQTGFRRPRQEFWEDRVVTVAEVRRMIADLDPVENDAEITHLSLEVIVPAIAAHAAYASGTARGMIHPAEAYAGHRGGTGEQLTNPDHRDRDTLTYFGMFFREGHRSAYAQRLFDRVQQIHHDVKGVSNDTQVHILGLLVFEPDQWIDRIGGRDWFSENEKQARYSLWKGVGEGMGLTGIPDSYDAFVEWVAAFERKHFKPTPEAAELYRGQIEGFSRWFPGPKPVSRRAAGQMLTAGLSDLTKQAVDAPYVAPGVRQVWANGIRVMRAAEHVRKVNLSDTWISKFSRYGATIPHDTDLQKVGYQHDMASDPRYLKAGDPRHGYTFTVQDGVRSARTDAESMTEENA